MALESFCLNSATVTVRQRYCAAPAQRKNIGRMLYGIARPLGEEKEEMTILAMPKSVRHTPRTTLLTNNNRHLAT